MDMKRQRQGSRSGQQERATGNTGSSFPYERTRDPRTVRQIASKCLSAAIIVIYAFSRLLADVIVYYDDLEDGFRPRDMYMRDFWVSDEWTDRGDSRIPPWRRRDSVFGDFYDPEFNVVMSFVLVVIGKVVPELPDDTPEFVKLRFAKFPAAIARADAVSKASLNELCNLVLDLKPYWYHQEMTGPHHENRDLAVHKKFLMDAAYEYCSESMGKAGLEYAGWFDIYLAWDLGLEVSIA